MESTPKFLLEIRQRLVELSGNNRVIAERIINYPEEVLQAKVSEFAERCHCDSAQVVRLCQKLGYDGFTSLKNRIAVELLDPKRTLHRQIAEPATSFEQLKRNFSLNFTRTINDTLANLDEETVGQAVGLIRRARHIVVCGFGSSALAARDLRIKLVRIGYYAMFLDDAENIRSLVATLSKEDLLILISFSGDTPYILDNVRVAEKNGVPVLALTNYLHSPLAESASCVLPTTADEQRLRLGAMDSTVAQFLVIDLLSSFMAEESPRQTEQRILQIFETTR
ncbi:MAG: MurR/RpiR family transcriptional regulator [Victivallales bacterium]|mgnify:FL=1|jgi:transcriptional regulator, RpiR family